MRITLNDLVPVLKAYPQIVSSKKSSFKKNNDGTYAMNGMVIAAVGKVGLLEFEQRFNDRMAVEKNMRNPVADDIAMGILKEIYDPIYVDGFFHGIHFMYGATSIPELKGGFDDGMEVRDGLTKKQKAQ